MEKIHKLNLNVQIVTIMHNYCKSDSETKAENNYGSKKIKD